MKDLFEGTKHSETRHIYSVAELTRDIKAILENTFINVWVEGEISNFARTDKGILFFSLKDNAGLLRCVMFGSLAGAVKFEIKDGMKMVCFGRVGVYEKDGRYQLYVEKIEPKGIGSLQLALEQLKEKLEKEGLFAPEHKRPIPYLPARIGIVTSITGAAIKDILNVLERRFKDAQIIINSVQVQGEGAKDDIARGIKDFNRFNAQVLPREKVEVLIVGRGGGSIEDLWAFNEETVARAIYTSSIPVISAIGHERDWTIADLVADVRAPTPSVAAELVIPRKEDLQEKLTGLQGGLRKGFSDVLAGSKDGLADLNHRLGLAMEHSWVLNRNHLESAVKKLLLLNPAVIIEQSMERIADSVKQMAVRMKHAFALKDSAFRAAVDTLASLSPLNILARGYSITFKMPEGGIIKDAGFLSKGDSIKTRLDKGEVISEVREIVRGRE
ncbi:MAG: exodeoxyribonuclease VII large subunit [Candidatus Omnitrophota bacterium]|jgi:exodeoxyribonuclease VII large subunit